MTEIIITLPSGRKIQMTEAEARLVQSELNSVLKDAFGFPVIIYPAKPPTEIFPHQGPNDWPPGPAITCRPFTTSLCQARSN